MQKLVSKFIIFLFFQLSSFCYADKILDEILSPAPEWMHLQITKDLAHFQGGVTEEMLQKTMTQCKDDPNLVLCEIKKNQLSIQFLCKNFRNMTGKKYFFARLQSIKRILQSLCHRKLLKDAQFLITMHDSVSFESAGPIFTFAKSSKLQTAVAFPDFEACMSYHLLKKEVEAVCNSLSYEEKKESAFWRGSSSGGVSTVDNWKSFPRSILCLTSKKHPHLIDAKFTNLIQIQDPLVYQEIRKHRLIGSNASKKKHLEYKYLIDVDGNSCTYSRMYWILLSNSVCLKQITQEEQWYYSGLDPYKHYIPLKHDLSDLLE